MVGCGRAPNGGLATNHASQLGWFLNVTRFRHSVLLAPGNVNRPIPALMNIVYLWGSFFSRHAPDGDLSAHENMFLHRALSQMGHALSGAPSHQVLQAVQAKMLLSVYYYCAGKFITGRHQSDSAAALVLACGLHKIRSAQINQQTSSYVDRLPIALVEARDQVEEGERINAMWTAFSMDRCWAVAFGVPSLISDSDALGTQIDTPWPLDMETYESGQIFPNLRTSCTLRNFLAGINTGWPWENQSLLAQVGKVSALFERATHLAECWRPGTTVSANNEGLMNMFFSSSEIPNVNTFYTNFVSMDQRIEEFKTQLYPLDNLEHVAADVVRTVHTIHCLANAASIQLHAAFAQQNAASRLKCLDAARAIVRANAAARAYEFSVVNPILGILWAAACQVFIRELVALRSYPLQAGPVSAEQDAELRSSLDQLEAVMAIFAPVCALIEQRLVQHIMSSFLDLYEPLDIIGNGSFGIIRKVRRKSDGVILARKELNFERMSERDRKQIVAEVEVVRNILKELNQEHIVRYHDRHVDRDAGILYILMEYCGGGDLSTVIKLAQKHNRPIPEDTIWNYFMQILLALHHCHHPNGHSRSGSNGSDGEGRERRAQILHRDLKPDNVFLDENNTVKLGDFGLSKALAQASFANTYVGTPYYMSPELMQEKAYDSKSDIWSLGCLIYELCALKPPFHEAKTHSELSIFIRNGRIPPLPRGYSQQLSSVIKAMLNLNPAMRPSAAQLLQHERLELCFKVSETQKMLTTVKSHKTALLEKERELLAREANLVARESMQGGLAQKDAEIAALRAQMAEIQSSVAVQIHQAIAKREDELRMAVLKREEEVAQAMQKREDEIMEAVRRREAEVEEAWRRREQELREECEREAEERWRGEWEKLRKTKEDVEKRMKSIEDAQKKPPGKREKAPLEDVHNIMAPLQELTKDLREQTPPRIRRPAYETPVNRNISKTAFPVASAMKGVILTETGEPLATPTPAEFANLFIETPKASDLGFAKIFNFDDDSGDEAENKAPPPSPLKQKGRPGAVEQSAPASRSTASSDSQSQKPATGTRLRRPSTLASRPNLRGNTAPTASSSTSSGEDSKSSSSAASSTTTERPQTTRSASAPAPVWDLADEENLPSPFLKRIDREKVGAAAASMNDNKASMPVARVKRPSAGNLLRAVAAANSAAATTSRASARSGNLGAASQTRASTNGRKAGEETKRALLRA
ncbi:hypothetical protein EWM64_g4429 [Hericium alpestre]|uniref:non-specific serine/threonine protein kinase n=1 Tax=Hericium alpestre TaxID=135208 RepID=A0A4Y9ZZV0_9AGAM|nr:hypothetical protein EWM64_g4429 [Hericium alpestre]